MENPKAVIADDEKNLRKALREKLKVVWPELNIAGEAANGREALALIRETAPDVVFLDIKMPGLDGMAVGGLAPTGVELVFVTAYDAHAVEAFEKGAADYLLKPVEAERLAATVERLKDRLADKNRLSPQQGATVKKAPDTRWLQWIKAGEGDRVRLVHVREVAYFEAADKYTRLFTDGSEHLIRTGIAELETTLDPEQFRRISRKAIVQLAMVESVAKGIGGGVFLHLKNRAEQLKVSRTHTAFFRRM